ncbi:MAG: transglycosylase SLT domain-containing protein [Pseudomonadota bacterium]|nr:MAG: hypothetical protein DIU72_07775 [Pseudomonadota bacterium]
MNIRSRWPRRIVGLAVFLSLALLPSVVRSNLEPLVGVVPLDPEVERIARFLERRAERTIDPQLRRQVASAVVEEARLAGLDPLYVLAVMEVESSFVPEAVSVANARGLLQLRDITIREISKHEELPAKAANEPEAIVHLRLGIRYLAMMHRKYGDPSRALAAWNAGPVAVDRALAASGEVPRRWLNFARKVQREHRNLQQIFGAEELEALDVQARRG